MNTLSNQFPVESQHRLGIILHTRILNCSMNCRSFDSLLTSLALLRQNFSSAATTTTRTRGVRTAVMVSGINAVHRMSHPDDITFYSRVGLQVAPVSVFRLSAVYRVAIYVVPESRRYSTGQFIYSLVNA